MSQRRVRHGWGRPRATWIRRALLLGTVLGLVGFASSTPAKAAAPWRDTGSMTTGRAGHSATLLPSGKVLVAGGAAGAAGSAIFASAELYDPTTETWQSTG